VDYTKAVDYIYSILRFTKKNVPELTVALLEKLGRPDRHMKIIHVAGSNGKGSVCAFLSSILTMAGKRTGLFTSPHLVRINERFQINNVPVEDEVFLDAYLKVMDAVKEMQAQGFAHPTYFEVVFAIGMVIFKEQQIEYTVLETGLGGRLDATNAVLRPIATVITSISLDHTEILGDTIELIAAEKAGIIKQGVPLVYDGRNPAANQVLIRRAHEIGADLYGLDESMYDITNQSSDSMEFILHSPYYKIPRVTIQYPAFYQVVNASLAMLTIGIINDQLHISEEVVVKGIEETIWPGRMETVLPGVILDGAHNASGIDEFVKTVQQITVGGRAVLLFSVVREKDYESMIETICKCTRFDTIIVTQIESERVVETFRLAEIFRKYTRVSVIEEPVIADALKCAMRKREDGILFCAGSLYLIGEIKRIISEYSAANGFESFSEKM